MKHLREFRNKTVYLENINTISKPNIVYLVEEKTMYCEKYADYTYSVKDITVSKEVIYADETSIDVSFIGVTTAIDSGEIVSEENITQTITFEPNTTYDSIILSGIIKWNDVYIDWSVTQKGIFKETDYAMYFENISNSPVTIGIAKNATGADTVTLLTSLDNKEWTTWGATAITPRTQIIQPNERLYIKNSVSLGKFNSSIAHNYFSADGDVKVGGNILSLGYIDFENKKGFNEGVSTSTSYVCYSLFENMSTLISAEDLIMPTSISNSNAFALMFRNCVNLVKAPKLPATTLSSSCYNGMFDGCINLVEAPELPATTLVNSCYNGMFNGCSKLNYVKAMFTTEPSSNYTNLWLNGVSEYGTFVKNANADWNVVGIYGIPVGWTVAHHDDSKLYSFGVLSDWHYGSATDRSNNKAQFVDEIDATRISDFYKEQQVDFMTLDGDLTYNGKVSELQTFKSMIDTQFINDGIPFYFNQGNHDAVCPDADYVNAVGREKNTVEVVGNDVFIFASQDYTPSRISDDTSDKAYANAKTWIINTLEKYKGYRIFLYIHYCFYGMAGSAPGVSYGFKNGSANAQAILDKVNEVGNTIVFVGHTHFDVRRDVEGTPTGYVNYQQLENNSWMVHVPSCGWCKTNNGKDEANCIKNNGIYRSQGYVAEAYPDKVIIKTYEFDTEQWLTDYVFEISNVVNKACAGIIEDDSEDVVIPEGQEHVVLPYVSVNQAYWDTDYMIQENDIMEWKGTLTKYSQYLMGAGESSTLKRFDFQYTSNSGKAYGKVQMGLGNSSYGKIDINLMDGQPHVWKGSKNEIWIDGVSKATNTSIKFVEPLAPIGICHINGSETSDYKNDTTHLFVGDFYEASIYDAEGNVKRHWVPVLTQEGIKLYETETQQYITHSGSLVEAPKS